MVSLSPTRRSEVQPSVGPRSALSLAIAVLFLVACAHSTLSSRATAVVPAGNLSTEPPSPDPRIGLRAGRMDAGEATWNLRVLSKTQFDVGENSDLAFTSHYVIQGNFRGFQVWDIAEPSHPKLETAYICPGVQNDVSVYKHLLFVSVESPAALDCGTAVPALGSPERLEGLRIFDISDISHPKPVGTVQTCRGSHTHSLLVDPKDAENVYIYISGSAPARSDLVGCAQVEGKPDSSVALLYIEVIQVPLAHPEQAAIVSMPRIFSGLHPPTSIVPNGFTMEEVFHLLGVDLPSAGGGDAAPKRSVTTIPLAQCHDITVYPALGLAGGACEGYGLLLDVSDPAHPVRLAAASDSNFAYWHSATFNNEGTKVVFTDEWGGGIGAKCRATDPKHWGADAIFTIADQNKKMEFQSYYKLPAPQTAKENCVAHNGSLIPIPGRDVMVQAWYQGGISVFDWTDAAHPKEIAFFDRGPLDSTSISMGGSWSAYWYNGVIVSSEIARGLDILELTPSGLLSQNELDAAKSVHLEYFNAQGQPKFVWPASFALARAYVDQLERSQELAAGRIAAVRQALTSAESASGAQRRAVLTALATQLNSEASGAGDAAKVRLLASAVSKLAAASR